MTTPRCLSLSRRVLLLCILAVHGLLARGNFEVSADSTKLGSLFPAGKPLVIAEPVKISHDVSSVGSFVVEDGPSSADVTFAAGISEVGGACGFTKDGAGTLRVAGEIRLSGFITVYDGTLDLSAACGTGGLRIHLMGDSRLVPPTENKALEIYINRVKLKPGAWGPPGSAGLQSPALAGNVQIADTGPSRQERWLGLKYGIFSHYVWNGYGMAAGTPNADGTHAQTVDEFADALDVPNYVNQLVEKGAQYVVFTAWHSGTCPLFPSAAMAKWAPGRPGSPKRDLLGDLLDECAKRGVRAFFYCHPYQPAVEPHNEWINDLFAELVDRYGDRLDGLWLDENFQDCSQDKIVDYRRLMRTIKERNPDLVLTQNNGGYQSYGVDQGVQEVQWEFREGRMASQYQIFNQTAKSPEDMLITTVIQAAANTMGGGIQWSIDAHGLGKNSRGGFDASSRPILDGFAKLLEPIADSVKNTLPSSSYPPPFSGVVVKLSNLPWGVATQSVDGSREFLHVLKAPAGNTLSLPPTADGKLFTNARLLDGGSAVSLSQNNSGLTLTLPNGVSWQTTDTVIAMDVLAPGGVGLVNDTSRAIRYSGNSWVHKKIGGFREFCDDSHRATAVGASFSFIFNGTDIAWIGSRGPGHGVVEIAIDGVSQGTVNLSKGGGNFQILFAKSGLKRGTHTLTGTLRSGTMMTVDAFKVSELINDSDPDIQFLTTTDFDARAAELAGSWEPQGSTWINGNGFNFRFRGTAVEVLGGSAYGSGDLVLTIDGKENSTVQCHGSQNTRSLAKISGLPDQEHTINGRYTNPHPSGFIPALDGFTVTRPDFWKVRKGRELGAIQGDIHVSELKGSTGKYTFNGSGIEIYTTQDAESRSVHYTLDGGGSSLWVGLSHYSPVPIPRQAAFRYPNLVPGTYTVAFKNAANPTGLNFPFVRLNIDAIRIYKGESPDSPGSTP